MKDNIKDTSLIYYWFHYGHKKLYDAGPRGQCYKLYLIHNLQMGQISQIVFFLGRPFQPRLLFGSMSRSLQLKGDTWMALALLASITLRWKGLPRVKHTSLYGLFVSYEEKSFITLAYWWKKEFGIRKPLLTLGKPDKNDLKLGFLVLSLPLYTGDIVFKLETSVEMYSNSIHLT